MGIKNLNAFLKKECPEIFQLIHISNFAFEKVAIDISLYMHKFKAIAGKMWLNAFLNLIASLRRNQIHSVFIFDGEAPIEKHQEQKKRRIQKEKLKNNIQMLEEAVEHYKKNKKILPILSELYKKRKSPRKRLLLSHFKTDENPSKLGTS